jgi:hypothetical protein
VLVVLSYLFRLPALINADSTNSDAAVVGLQAMHVLRGEASPFLWGSGYQTSTDSFVAAAFFAVLGASPLALMASALTLHVVATLAVFDTLRHRLDAWAALVGALPLVFTASSVHSYALYPPRQAALTLALGAFWAMDRAGRDGARAAWFLAGPCLFGVATYADPYPLVLAPVFAVLCVWTAAGGQRAAILRRIGLAVAGALVGLLPGWLLRHTPGAKNGPLGLTTSVVEHNLRLLWDECLPWALSYKIYTAKHVMDYAPWDAPAPVRAFLVLAAVWLLLLVGSGLAAATRKEIPSGVRALGVTGALAYPVTLVAFSVSVMVMDHFSMRYLAAMTLMTPFALAPLLHRVGAQRGLAMVLPCVLASAIGGWVGYGPFVLGTLPVVPREIDDDRALGRLLRAEGIDHAVADYWASYRLTLLFREHPTVVPRSEVEDRYPPYRRAFLAAPRYAYVWDPGRSRETLTEAEDTVRREARRVSRREVGTLVVFLVER